MKSLILVLLTASVSAFAANQDVVFQSTITNYEIAKDLFEIGERGENEILVQGLAGEVEYETSYREEEGKSFKCQKLVRNNLVNEMIIGLSGKFDYGYSCTVVVKFSSQPQN